MSDAGIQAPPAAAVVADAPPVEHAPAASPGAFASLPKRRTWPGRLHHRRRSVARSQRKNRPRRRGSRRGRDRTGRAVQRSARRWPTIQRASERALRSGATLAGVIDLVRASARAHRGAAGAFQLFQSHLADGPREICAKPPQPLAPMACWPRIMTPEEAGEYRADHARARPRHDFPRRAHFHRRAPGANRRMLPAGSFT